MKKKILGAPLLLLTSFVCGQAPSVIYQVKLNNAINSTNCSAKKMITAHTFKTLSKQYLSRIVSNNPIQTQAGSYASLKLNAEKTTADLQVTFPSKGYHVFTIGFNATVTDNLANLYSGKDGISPDWGVKAGWNWQCRNTVFYYESNCAELQRERKILQYKLLAQDTPSLRLDRTALLNTIDIVQRKIDSLQFDISSQKFTAGSNRLVLLQKELSDSVSRLFFLSKQSDFARPYYKYDKKSLRYIVNDKGIKDSIDARVTSFELEKAVLNGYSTWLVNFNVHYNRRGFMQFLPSVLPVASRFEDTAYNSFGVNIGLSYFRFTQVFHNISFSAGYKRKSNLELEENQKHNRTYLTETIIPNTTAGTMQYATVTKKAFDSSAIVFKPFGAIELTGQYTALFGKLKSFGFNAFANVSNSGYYTLPNRLDLGFGPVISIVNEEKSTSRINFSLFGSFKNVFDKSTTANDKFTVNFNVQVPFTFIK